MAARPEASSASAASKSAPARTRRLPWVLLALGFVLVGVACAWFFLGPAADDGMEPNVVVGSLEGYTDDELAAMANDKVEEGMIAFSLNTQVTMDGPDGKAQILFENPANNAKLLKLVLTRDDTGEQVYATGYVAPGSYVDEETLDVLLEPGSYTCTALVKSYRQDTKKFIGQAAAQVVVTVKDPAN